MPGTNYPDGVLSRGVPLPSAGDLLTTGEFIFVDSNTDSSQGTEEHPYSTLAAAIAVCTASKLDTIIIKPGHAETVLVAKAINVAGIRIIGLGNGDNRPTFTLTGQVPCLNIKSDDIKISNLRFYSATAATSYAQNFMRIAANDIDIIGCEFKTNQKMYHTIRIKSGDKVRFLNCTFLHTYAPGTGAAGVKAQDCILNIGGTSVLVKSCRFNDISADKSHRWKAVIEGGKLTASLDVEDCDFVCRGIATRTRSAAASGYMATKYCRAISPSSNTAVGALYTPTYQYILESYNVAAVNKQNLLAASTSDLRMKTAIVYL